jgi:hypothetical protein
MTEAEKAREFWQKWVDSLDLQGMLLDLFVTQGGVPDPRTGKYRDRAGIEYDTREEWERYGDAFLLPAGSE